MAGGFVFIFFGIFSIGRSVDQSVFAAFTCNQSRGAAAIHINSIISPQIFHKLTAFMTGHTQTQFRLSAIDHPDIEGFLILAQTIESSGVQRFIRLHKFAVSQNEAEPGNRSFDTFGVIALLELYQINRAVIPHDQCRNALGFSAMRSS